MPKPFTHKLLTFFPILLFLLNVITKSLYLTSQDIGLDEPFSIYHAQFGFADLVSQLKNYNNPPLYELLLHGWISLSGISPLAVRALPLLFAAMAPVVLFYFGRRYFSTAVAVTSSLLLSCSSLLFYYAHDCRVYSLFLLLCILSMHFFLALTETQKNKIKNAALFILFSSLLIYAHYFGIFILLFQALYLLAFYRGQLLKFTGYYLLTLVLYLPHAYILFRRLGTSVTNGTWLQPPAGIESLYNMLWSFSNYPFVTVLCIAILLGGTVAGLRQSGQLHNYKKTVLMLCWFLLPFFGMFIISFWVPMYISRYLIFVLPAYYILLALCIENLFKNGVWRHTALIILVLCFAFTSQLNPDKKQNIAASMPFIKSLKDANTLVIVTPKDFLPSFAYHYNRQYFSAIGDHKEYHQCDSLLKSEQIFLVDGPGELAGLDLHRYSKIIYVASGQPVHDLEKDQTPLFFKKFNDNYSISVFRNF